MCITILRRVPAGPLPLLVREEDGLNRGSREQPGPRVPGVASWGYGATQPPPVRHAQGTATGGSHQMVAGGLEHLNKDGRDGTRRAIALIPVSMDDGP